MRTSMHPKQRRMDVCVRFVCLRGKGEVLRPDVTRSTAQDPRGEEVLTTRDRSCLDFAERRSSPRSSLRHDESGGEEVLTLTRATMPGMATEADSHEGKRIRQPLRSAR